MNNFQKIKAMDMDEMAKFLGERGSMFIVKKCASDWINEDLIKQWLESEVRE